MNRSALAISIVVFGVANAHAADLAPKPYVKAPSIVSVPHHWNGFYIGANAGYAFEDPTVTTTPNDLGSIGFLPATPTQSFDIKGAFGGVQAGYNWTANSSWLVGLEADIQYSNIRGSASFPSTLYGVSLGYEASDRVKWFGTVRGRLGYLVTPDLLFFGTGGLAYGRVDQRVSLNITPGQTSGFSYGDGPDVFCEPSLQTTCYGGSSSRTAIGYAAGGGAEYAFGSNWSLKVEYLYVNLGSNSFISNATISELGSSSSAIHFSDTAFHTVRGGINFHF